MQHLTQIAKAYYKNSSWQLNKEAHKFFNCLDGDGDGRVNKHDFVSFMTKHAAGRHMSSPAWFDQFDTDGNGTLTFWEVTTILYIIKSGRPFCHACTTLCMATYFTCLECPHYFVLCFSCYEKGDSGHNHHHQFLDNYALLTLNKTSSDSSNAITTTGSSSNNTREKMMFALKTLEIGVDILSNCTTM